MGGGVRWEKKSLPTRMGKGRESTVDLTLGRLDSLEKLGLFLFESLI